MFYVFPDEQALAAYVADLLNKRLAAKPNLKLGLATGRTMLPIYAAWCDSVKKQALNVAELHTYNLDEYLGLALSHPQSFYTYMQHNVFAPLGLKAEQTHYLDGMQAETKKECRRYAELVEQAKLDVQLLGIGGNGHIGFNEPYTPFNSRAQVVELALQTRQDNSSSFGHLDNVPTHAITLGLADIMSAKEIILVATGAHKAEIMAQLFHGPVSEAMPASVLKQHLNVQMLMDEAAASLLPRAALSRLSY